MQFSTSVIAAVAAILPVVSGHIAMVSPPPYPGTESSSPLDGSGSNFPCKLSPGAAAQAAKVTYTPGEESTFVLKGSAVHGGGSCQVSITYDNPPTVDSVFKVVQSYEGGCPLAATGNLPANPDNGLPPIPVTLPEGLKAGEAVFAWTWFNKIGNREMYMACSAITIGGSGTSNDIYDSLPDMFVANLEIPKSECTTTETTDIVFPNPGQNVIVNKEGATFAAACKGGPSEPGPGNGSGSTPAPSSSAAAPPSVTTQPALVGGPEVSTVAVTVGTSFTKIGGPVDIAPTTTLLTMTTTAAALPTKEVTTTVAVSIAPPSSTVIAAPQPSNPASGNGSSGSYVIGKCNAAEGIIRCKSSNKAVYTQCYDDGQEYGPFPVPGGTECDDSTTNGGFKAIAPGNSRMLRRSLRKHKRGLFHGHSH